MKETELYRLGIAIAKWKWRSKSIWLKNDNENENEKNGWIHLSKMRYMTLK